MESYSSSSGQLEVEPLVDLVHGDHPGHHGDAVGAPSDLGRLHVVLVGDLADQLLEQVLQRDEPCRAAVLVDDDCECTFSWRISRSRWGTRLVSGTNRAGRATSATGEPAWPSRSARARGP